MTNRIRLPKSMVNALCSGEGWPGWEILAIESMGEWRWGVCCRLIVRDPGGEDCWAYDYRETVGDGFWRSTEDEGDEIELYRVEPFTVPVTKYRKVAPGREEAG